MSVCKQNLIQIKTEMKSQERDPIKVGMCVTVQTTKYSAEV